MRLESGVCVYNSLYHQSHSQIHLVILYNLLTDPARARIGLRPYVSNH